MGRARAPPRAGRLAGAHAAALRGGGPRAARGLAARLGRGTLAYAWADDAEGGDEAWAARADAAAAANDRARRERVDAAIAAARAMRAPARSVSSESSDEAARRRRRGDDAESDSDDESDGAMPPLEDAADGCVPPVPWRAESIVRRLAAAPPDEAACCPICLDALGGDVVEMPCRWLEHEDRAVPHAFHRDCALELLNASASRGERVPRCPTCRDDFPPHLLVAHPEDPNTRVILRLVTSRGHSPPLRFERCSIHNRPTCPSPRTRVRRRSTGTAHAAARRRRRAARRWRSQSAWRCAKSATGSLRSTRRGRRRRGGSSRAAANRAAGDATDPRSERDTVEGGPAAASSASARGGVGGAASGWSLSAIDRVGASSAAAARLRSRSF